jgi:hypothetical protein
LTFTYFLRAFSESKDRTRCYKSRPIAALCPTMAFSSSPTHPTLGANHQHSPAALTRSLWSNSRSRSICNIHEIETHPQNLFRSRCRSDGELPNQSPSGPCVHSTLMLSRGTSLFIRMKIFRHLAFMEMGGCRVSWCTCEVCLLVFYTNLTDIHRNNPHVRCKTTCWDVIRCIVNWGYQSIIDVVSKTKVFGRCKSCNKILFEMWSTQQSSQQQLDLDGMDVWVSLSPVCGLEVTDWPSVLDFLFKTTSGPAEAWKPRGAVLVDPRLRNKQSLLIYM